MTRWNGHKAVWISVAIAASAVSGMAQAALTGIAATRHNLSSTSTVGAQVSNTDQVCVFCHTPHGSNTSIGGAPLWNKRAPASSYTLYSGPGTMDSATAALGATSRVCLSCHDGTQAMDNLLNAPGSGGFLSDGGGNSGLSYSWTTAGSNGIDTNGFLTTANAANLGFDLSNDHPVAIQYCGGGLTGNGTTGMTAVTSCRDPDFRAPDTSMIGGRRVWWVEQTDNNVREKTDLILFTRAGTDYATTNETPTIECATCHEVHGGGATGGVLFLRITAATSTICTTCHVK